MMQKHLVKLHGFNLLFQPFGGHRILTDINNLSICGHVWHVEVRRDHFSKPILSDQIYTLFSPRQTKKNYR